MSDIDHYQSLDTDYDVCHHETLDWLDIQLQLVYKEIVTCFYRCF